MKRLLKKQGFTLMETAVVVVIIALTLAIVIPLVSTDSARKREARDNARAFYSNVQELMFDEKFVSDTQLIAHNEYMLIYAEVSPPDDDGASESSISFAKKNNITDFANAAELTTIDKTETSNDRLKEFAVSLSRLLSTNSQSVPVFYYAVVDSKYRVVFTYYSLGEYERIAGKTFRSECFAGAESVLTGSYPYSRSEEGEIVFGDKL